MAQIFTLTADNHEQVLNAVTERINGYIVRRYVRNNGVKSLRILEVINPDRGFGSVNIYVHKKVDEDFHLTNENEFEFTINNGAWDLNQHDAEEQLYKYCAAVMCVRELARTEWCKVPLIYVKEDEN